jgi:tetratricopeptide (TPR) repeat protein
MRLLYAIAICAALAAGQSTWSPIAPAHATKSASERASRLDELFAKLQAAKSDDDADPIIADIWSVWNLSGSEQVDEIMQRALSLMHMGALGMALEVLDGVVAMAPDHAEGWNRRATVLFHIGQYDRSLKDCEEVLRREPRHFGAMAGMGMIALAQGRHGASLMAYRRALKVNPFMKERRELIPALEKKVDGRDL